ncbi:MAG: molybdopterin-dependent oxidoreductase [Gemmatimonadaceae bacterium]
MELSRRDFLRYTAGAGAGTALGGIVGLGLTLAPARAKAQVLRIKGSKTVPSICPFCSVGCGTLIHVKEGEIVNIEGDPRSPHSEGTLCPKGAAIYQLHKNINRPTRVLHRKPGARDWEEVDIEWAMDRVSELVSKTRDETFIEKLPDGKTVNATSSIFHLGGATLDNEFNHIAQKFCRGFGIVAIENQARICHSSSVPGLGARLGRGAATMFPRDMSHSDCVVIMGSNMAECHPVAFRWPLKARVNGAKLIHVDPRFTRTSANCDIHAPIRSGSDIAFLGGIINHVLSSDRWNGDPFFQSFVSSYTNASTIVSSDYRDTEDLDGVFSGLREGKEDADWPFSGATGDYDPKSWQYAGSTTKVTGEQVAYTARAGLEAQHQNPQGAKPGYGPGVPRNSGTTASPTKWDILVHALLKPTPQRDPSMKDPHCVLQLLKRHYSRYTPEMVEQVTGCTRAKFLKVAETVLANSGADRTTSFAYAVAWTQHTDGVQMINCCALLQLLLGNMGRPGGGIMALRGHASIQGSTDVPTLYHSIHGYMSAPSTLKEHDTLHDFLATETQPTGYWANTPKFMVSYLKSMYGDAAKPENDYGYGWHPKIFGDFSHIAMMSAMAEDRVKGMIVVGQNPATSLNASAQRMAMRKLEWLVVKDNWLTETATQWKNGPEITDGSVKIEDIKTEIFFFPATQVGEYNGSFTNTQRMLQWHFKAAEPPGDCRTDTWFYYQLGKRLKTKYASSTQPRDEGWNHLVWDYERDSSSAEAPDAKGEPDELKLLREINGFRSSDASKQLSGFAELEDDGSTTCASWIYCGVFPAWDRNLSARREPDPPSRSLAEASWGWAWPANRRLLYNRASADPSGKSWSERKRWIWWDPSAPNAPDAVTGKTPAPGKWVGYDVPDFTVTKAPTAAAKKGGIGLDAHSGTEPFIMKPDGRGWLFVPTGLVDGPFPVHYEPIESPVHNQLYKQQYSPVLKWWSKGKSYNQIAAVGDPRYPCIITTYRLTEHYLSGAMSRWLPYLAELQPELFCEIGRDLAHERGIANLDFVKITSPRHTVRAKALVTNRIGSMMLGGKKVHHVGMPWHWGWQGLAVGDVVNNLTSWVGDPNVSIHEGKAFVCNVEKA